MNKLADIITTEITKTAKSRQGHNENEIDILLEDISLKIDNEEKKCTVGLTIEMSFDWWIDEETYWEPEDKGIKNLDYWIKDITIDCEDGTIYSEEKQRDILHNNREHLNDLSEELVETEAYNIEWQEE